MKVARLFIVLTFLSLSSPVNACLNDSELPDHEREFRSQYLDAQLMTSTDSPNQQNDGTWMMSAAGVGLLIGAVGLTWFGRR